MKLELGKLYKVNTELYLLLVPKKGKLLKPNDIIMVIDYKMDSLEPEFYIVHVLAGIDYGYMFINENNFCDYFELIE